MATSYDQVVYDSKPRATTHPGNLAALATMHGMTPAPVATARVLEIGCATGGNLFDLAEAFPQARFLGIDPSPRQIDMGRQVALALGLNNLKFEAVGIDGLADGAGPFDYVICHGVYSWVNDAAREAILAGVRRVLSPQGVAYLSYNAKPGWYLRQPIREMMKYHVRDIPDPMERIAQARALLRFLVVNAHNKEGAWAKALHDELDMSALLADSYVMHEHLEDDNEAFYLHEVLSAAEKHGLRYLSEASQHTVPSTFSPEVRDTIGGLGDLAVVEQYADFLRGRMFRRTLLVRDNVRPDRSMTAAFAAGLYVTATSKPRAEIDPFAPGAAVFQNDDGNTVSTSWPLMKAALVELVDVWPMALSVEELGARAGERLAAGGVETSADDRAPMGTALIQMALSGLVELSGAAPRFTTNLSERPTASPLARRQAIVGAEVTNRRHRATELAGVDRLVLPLLDGRSDRPALVTELVKRVMAGDIGLTVEGLPPVTEEAAARKSIESELDGSLSRLARSAVLIG